MCLHWRSSLAWQILFKSELLKLHLIDFVGEGWGEIYIFFKYTYWIKPENKDFNCTCINLYISTKHLWPVTSTYIFVSHESKCTLSREQKWAINIYDRLCQAVCVSYFRVQNKTRCFLLYPTGKNIYLRRWKWWIDRKISVGPSNTQRNAEVDVSGNSASSRVRHSMSTCGLHSIYVVPLPCSHCRNTCIQYQPFC